MARPPTSTAPAALPRGGGSIGGLQPNQRGGGSSGTGIRRGRAGSTHEIVSGARRVKGYPVTRDELFGLGGAGLLATTCFSIGGNLVNRSFDIQKDLELTQGITSELKARWETKEADSWQYGLVFVAIGIVAILVGGVKVLSIIRSTEHPDE